MSMALKVHRWTRADLASIADDGNRYEVLDGKLLVTPQARLPHQWIGARLIVRLGPYAERHQLGVVVGPGAVIFGPNELQPDVAVVPVTPDRMPEKWDDAPQAILVAEILSTTTRRRDLGLKREAYQRIGIPNYWVIDRFQRRALSWTPQSREASIHVDELRWQPRAGIDPLVIPLTDILPPLPEG